MLSLYSVQFTIAPEEDQEAEAPRIIKEMVRRWISGSRRMDSVVLPTAPGLYTFHDDQQIIVTEEMSDDRRVFLWSLTWKHPDDNDWQVLRVATCQLASYDGDMEFSLRMHAEPRVDDFVLSPRESRLRFGRPAVVPLLVRKFPCFNHQRRLFAAPHKLYADEIGDFVQDTLFSSERYLPAVVFSIDQRSGQHVGSPDTVAEYLAGLAEVYTLADIPTSYELTTHLGKLLSCYNGAVRIYYPGFSLRSNYEECPLYMADSVLFLQHDYSLARKLLRLFSSVAVMRYAPGAVFRKAEAALISQRRPSIVVNDHETLSWDDTIVERLVRDEVQQYRNEMYKLQSRVSTLERSLNDLREQISAYVEEADPDEDTTDQASRFASVADAVQRAEQDFGDVLIFHEKAHDSAERSPYGQPDRVYRALEAMAEVAAVRRGALLRGESMGALEEAFRERGFTYTAHISMTSRGQYGYEYEITYNNEKRDMHEHLVLGKGSPKTCLRIHFFWDEDLQSFVVGHVGRHKTNTRS